MALFDDVQVRRELAALAVGETRCIAGTADVKRVSWTRYVVVIDGEDSSERFYEEIADVLGRLRRHK